LVNRFLTDETDMTLPPTEILFEALCETVGPPFVVAVVTMLLARLLFGNSSASVAAVVALIASLAIGNHLAKIHSGWLPTDRRLTWLPWLAAMAAISGMLIRKQKSATIGYTLWAVVMAMAVVRVVPKDYQTVPMVAVPAFVVLTAIIGFGLMKLSQRQPGSLAPLILAACLMTAGTVTIYAHSKSLLDIATLGAMALFGISAVVCFTRGEVGAVLPGVAILLTGTLFAAFHETESLVPTTAFVLPCVAPLLAFVAFVPAVERWRPIWRWAAVWIPITLLLIAAVTLAATNESLAFESEY